jgi:hypothetical protein
MGAFHGVICTTDDLAVQLVGPAGIVFEHFGDFADFAPGVADRLAGGEHFEFREVGGVLADQTCDLPHRPAARRRGHRRPLLLAGAGRLHGLIDDRRAGIGVRQKDLAVGRIDEVERLARARHDVAADEAADAAAWQQGLQKRRDAGARVDADGAVRHLRSPEWGRWGCGNRPCG